jgi:hypothetical protein
MAHLPHLLLLAERVAVPLPLCRPNGRTLEDPTQTHPPVTVVPRVRHAITTAVRHPDPHHVTGRTLPLEALPPVTRRPS